MPGPIQDISTLLDRDVVPLIHSKIDPLQHRGVVPLIHEELGPHLTTWMAICTVH
jgi:hypothetical protein